jgi:hypothetical protein
VEGAADEDEADCCWYANAWADATRRAAAIAKHFMVRVIEGSLPYYRAIKSQNKAWRTGERLLDNE